MQFSLLALDFDGVIMDSVEVKAEAMRRIGEPFGPELRDRLLLYHRIEGGINRVEKFRWLYREAYGREIPETELADMVARFADYIGDALLACPFLPGLDDLLRDWHGKVPIYVCSGAMQHELEALLSARGMAGYFQGIRGYPPEKTTLLGDILREARVDPATAVMVGDTATDSRAAEANGALFFGIGEQFAGASCPHGEDLRDVNAWLHTLGPRA